MYSPLEEYLGIIAKLGLLPNSNFCASVSGLQDRFCPSGCDVVRACVTGLEDVVAIFVNVVTVEVLELDSVLEVLGFEWPL